MNKFLFFLIISFIFTLETGYGEGTLSVNMGGIYEDDETPSFKPDVGILAGFDSFKSLTNSMSFFSSTGGSINYRYMDNEWNYLYNCSVLFSYRNSFFTLIPSIIANGEYLFTTDLSTPHIWDNSLSLYFSYDIGETSVYIDPVMSWENNNYFLKCITGYIFPFLTYYIFTLEFSVGKTLFESEQDELFFYPKIIFSWYPDKPYTLTSSFIFTWYDSDYESIIGESIDVFPIFDFMEVFSDIEFSVIPRDNMDFSFYIPFSMVLKRYSAVNEEQILDENEWIFSTGFQIDVSVDFHTYQRFAISISGEKAFSNTIYHESEELVFSLSYEFVF